MTSSAENVGHFTEVHDITDSMNRQLIVHTLGINLWGDWEMKINTDYQPEVKRGRVEGSVVGDNVDWRQLSLENLSKMERRMGLKEEWGGHPIHELDNKHGEVEDALRCQ